MKTAVAYARVSTEQQTLDRQWIDIKNYCKINHIKLIEKFEDKISGTITDAPILKKMMQHVEKNKPNMVIVSEISRLGRHSQIVILIEQLKEWKVDFVSLKELSIDTSTPEGMMIFGVMASVNKYELSAFKYRSKSGLYKYVSEGNWAGGILPYGYRKDGHKLVIYPEEAEVVKRIFTSAEQKNSTYKIATILNDEGIKSKTGMKWRDAVIYQLLNNSIYYGLRKYKEKNLEAPAIISKDQFDHVREIIKSNIHKVNMKQKYEYLLDDQIIKCGICGKSYYARYNKHNKERNYKCISTRYKNESCGNYGISIDKLDKSIDYFLVTFQGQIVSENLKVPENIEVLNKRINELENKMKQEIIKEGKLAQMVLDNIISIEGSKTSADSIKKAKNSITRELSEIRSQMEYLANSSKYVNYFKVNKDIIHKIIKKIVITKSDHQLADYWKFKNGLNKQDKTVRVEVYILDSVHTFYISQRTNTTDFSECFGDETYWKQTEVENNAPQDEE